MLRIGYIFDTDLISGQPELSPAGKADLGALEAAGCNVVRIETGGRRRTGYGPVLQSVLEFAGQGDEVLVMRADQLASSATAILAMIQNLQDRHVTLKILEDGLSNQGEIGETLIKAADAAIEGLKAKKPIYVGPLKDNSGKVVIDKTYDNYDPFLDGMNYLLEGVKGSLT